MITYKDTGIEIEREDVDFVIVDINPDGKEYALIYVKGGGVFSSPTWSSFKSQWVSNRGIGFMVKDPSNTNLIDFNSSSMVLNPTYLSQPWMFEAWQKGRFTVYGEDNFLSSDILGWLGSGFDFIPWGSSAIKIQRT